MGNPARGEMSVVRVKVRSNKYAIGYVMTKRGSEDVRVPADTVRELRRMVEESVPPFEVVVWACLLPNGSGSKPWVMGKRGLVRFATDDEINSL